VVLQRRKPTSERRDNHLRPHTQFETPQQRDSDLLFPAVTGGFRARTVLPARLLLGTESRSTTWCARGADSVATLETEVVLHVWHVVLQRKKPALGRLLTS
jgi:hypothetical protein